MLITTANAAEYGKRGAESANRNREKTAVKLRVLEHSSFETQEVVRVREHIVRVNSMLEVETEAVNILRLAQALNKLHEDERKLAGRPDPGSYRPTSPKEKRTKTTEPVEEA